MSKETYDVAVIGSGPAGLTAGITAARAGLSAIILEKREIAGPFPRGEGISSNSFLKDLLGDMER